MDMRVLVMGLGFFGKNWLKEVLACTECEVAGIVAKHPELLATVGEAFTVAPSKRFTTIEEGLDRSQAQAVIVALPEMVHKRAILAALHRGLHVLTEKPLAMDMTEAAEVVRAARRAQGAILMVDQNYRWRPQTRALRRAIREGRIGRVASASYEFRQSILRPTTDAWREEMPHPYLHDIAIHHFDLLRACTGQECTEVLAVPVRPPWSWYRGLPALDAILTFDQGASVSYTGSMVARGFITQQDGLITIVGEGGTLRLEADGQVRCYRDTQVEAVPPEAMPFTDTAYALREFLAAIREARRPETDVEDNVRSLAMVAAAVTSAEKRQPVAVAPLVAEALAA
ncbi:MAG: Gfo/Idh/MocA family oxidoreductase [candidate division NC10 bacterium]|nr:Gfo/Idh/MocA family oxidoreductase [candidate division NC10 bacterium]